MLIENYKIINSLIISIFCEIQIRPNDSKRAKASADDDEVNVANLVCTSRFSYEHLLNIHWLNDTELVAVGVNPITMIAQLPSSLKEKRFGVS